MDLKYLYTFRSVAEEMSFTNAAYKLNYAQSSISEHIRALESEWNVLLFERIGRHIRLTEEGRQLLKEAEIIIQHIEHMKEIASGSGIPSGRLTIGAHESQLTYRMIGILREFRLHYPDVQLVFRPIILDESIKNSLKTGDVDAAFLLGPFDLNFPEMIIEPLVEERILVLSSVNHPLTKRKHITPDCFQNETILTTEQGCSYREIFERILNGNGVHTGAKIEFASIEAIKQCVMEGMGVAVLPEITVSKELSEHLIAALPCDNFTYSLYSHIAWHKDKWISPALDAFLKMVRQMKEWEKR